MVRSDEPLGPTSDSLRGGVRGAVDNPLICDFVGVGLIGRAPAGRRRRRRRARDVRILRRGEELPYIHQGHRVGFFESLGIEVSMGSKDVGPFPEVGESMSRNVKQGDCSMIAP